MSCAFRLNAISSLAHVRGGSLRCRRHLPCGRIVAEFLQSSPVFTDQPRRRPNCFCRLLQLTLDPIEIGKRAPNLFAKGSILPQEIGALRPHPFEQGLEHVEITGKPLACRSEYPYPVLLSPAGLFVNLPKLALLFSDDDPDRDVPLLGVTHKFVEVVLRYNGFVFVIDQHLWLRWGTARIAVRHDEVAVLRKLFADTDARPSPRLVCETHFFQLADTGNLCHLGFQLLITLPKLRDLAEIVLDSTIEVFPLRFSRAELSFQFRSYPLDIESLSLIGDSCSRLKFFEPTTECLEFISMALLDLCGSLGEFSFETSPDVLLIVAVLLEEQAEGFFRAQLGNSCEIFHTETIQDLGALQLAFAQTQRALNGFGRHRQLGGHAVLPALLNPRWHSVAASHGTSRQTAVRSCKYRSE